MDNPLELDRSQHTDEKKRVTEFLSDYLPKVGHEVVKHDTCMYTKTPDENFIVDRHPEHENVVLGAGFSGHGFKFAPVLGRVLADMAMEGATDSSIEFLSLSRFRT